MSHIIKAALEAAKATIEIDRTSLADTSMRHDNTMDPDGAQGVAEYDAVLAQIDAGLAALPDTKQLCGALELADQLEQRFGNTVPTKQAAAMLRWLALSDPIAMAPASSKEQIAYWEVSSLWRPTEVLSQEEFTRRSFDTGRFRPLIYADTSAPAAEQADEEATVADYQEALRSVDALVRRLDVALNGKVGAAPQARLCDLVSQVEQLSAQKQAPDQAEPLGASEDVQRFAIEVEKLLCKKLERDWAVSGMSIITLIDDLASRAEPALVPMTRDQVKEMLSKAGYDFASAQGRADFINGIRHGERFHGITAQAGDLWCIHIPGPDELHAAPSKAAAEHMAARHNQVMDAYLKSNPIGEGGPSVESVQAVVKKWPHDSQSHANALHGFDYQSWGLSVQAGEGA